MVAFYPAKHQLHVEECVTLANDGPLLGMFIPPRSSSART
jgi:hypothetical protein